VWSEAPRQELYFESEAVWTERVYVGAVARLNLDQGSVLGSTEQRATTIPIVYRVHQASALHYQSLNAACVIPSLIVTAQLEPGAYHLPDEVRASRECFLPAIFDYHAAYATSGATHYLREAFLFLPMLLANRLRRAGEYVAALDWLRTVYDYAAPLGSRALYPGLGLDNVINVPGPAYFGRVDGWMRDLTDPHAIAATRPLAYARYVIIELLGTLLDFADAEFTVDTLESIPRARSLYSLVLSLLQEVGAILPAEHPDCGLAELPALSEPLALIQDEVHPLDEQIGRALWRELEALSSGAERVARAALSQVGSSLRWTC
jgi:hypothetical protein